MKTAIYWEQPGVFAALLEHRNDTRVGFSRHDPTLGDIWYANLFDDPAGSVTAAESGSAVVTFGQSFAPEGADLHFRRILAEFGITPTVAIDDPDYSCNPAGGHPRVHSVEGASP